MPVRRQCGRHVHQMHHLSAEKFSQRICLRRQHDFRHLRTRCAHRLPWQITFLMLRIFLVPLHSHSDLGSSLDAACRTRIIRDDPMTGQKKNSRQMLEQFVANKPEDAFSRYGLAMECMNTGDPAAADTHFRALLEHNSDYVPAYLMYAQLLAREARTAAPKQILSTGIA